MTYKMDNIMQHLMVIRPIISYWGIDKLLALLRCKDDEGKRLKKVNLVCKSHFWNNLHQVVNRLESLMILLE